MSLKKDRTRQHVRGLGDLEVRQTEPAADADFQNAGYLDESGTDIIDDYTMEEIFDENGNLVNVLEKAHKVTIATNLSQRSIDELNLIKGANGKAFALRYFGKPSPSRFQYFCLEQCKLNPSLKVGYKPGKNPLPLQAWALKQDDFQRDIPVYYVAETMGVIRIKDLALWVNPRIAINTGTQNILDISGFGRHGLATSGYAGMWQSGFLRLDGAEDAVDFGNILNDDGVSDFLLECWVRVQGDDGSLQPVLTKRNSATNAAGFALNRSAANKIQFVLGDGDEEAAVSSTSSVLQNVWKHVAVSVDRNGNATIYLNGAADGSASVAAVESGENALSFFAGRDNVHYGEIDIDMVRFYQFGAGNMPTDIATILSNHFQAERGYYGV